MVDKKVDKKEPVKELLTTEKGTMSERFTNAVMKEFSSIAGKLEFTAYQKRLAQHLFIKIDASLNEFEKKRQEKDKDSAPVIWGNINMQKLAVDAVHRVELGLDALIPNHISPIPYWNTRMQKYDLDLRVGYAGKDYYRRQVALDPPVDIIYELVRESDVFVPIKKAQNNAVETYKFEIPKPFARGKVIGGFAYLIFKDQDKNKLVIVTEEEFKKSEEKAQSKTFWTGYPDEMRHKTLVIKGTNKLQIDPAKVNASFAAVEADDQADAAMAQSEIDKNANTGEVLQIPEKTGGDEKSEEETIPAPPVCVCDQMVKEKIKEWTCPEHGTYQGGKFIKPEAKQQRAPGF